MVVILTDLCYGILIGPHDISAHGSLLANVRHGVAYDVELEHTLSPPIHGPCPPP